MNTALRKRRASVRPVRRSGAAHILTTCVGWLVKRLLGQRQWAVSAEDVSMILCAATIATAVVSSGPHAPELAPRQATVMRMTLFAIPIRANSRPLARFIPLKEGNVAYEPVWRASSLRPERRGKFPGLALNGPFTFGTMLAHLYVAGKTNSQRSPKQFSIIPCNAKPYGYF